MPLPGAQAATVPVEKMPFVMVRLLLRPGATYGAAAEASRRSTRIPEPQEGCAGRWWTWWARRISRAIPAYVPVNNKAGRVLALTIEGLAEGSRLPALRL